MSESSCTTTASGSLVIVPGTGQSMTAVWMHRRLLSSARSCCTRHGAVISSGDPHLRLHQTIDRITMLHATGCCISGQCMSLVLVALSMLSIISTIAIAHVDCSIELGTAWGDSDYS